MEVSGLDREARKDDQSGAARLFETVDSIGKIAHDAGRLQERLPGRTFPGFLNHDDVECLGICAQSFGHRRESLVDIRRPIE